MKTSKNPQKDGDLKSETKPNKVKGINKKAKSKKSVEANVIKEAVEKEIKEIPKNISVADKAKIEKKKAKKAAQKLKKQQRKSTKETIDQDNNDVEVTDTTNQKAKEKGKSLKDIKNKDADVIKRERDPAAEAATIFVGNLPINTKRVQLIRLLQPYSAIQSIRLRTAGGKKLFKHKQRKGAVSLNAYVVLESSEVAAKALSLNGTEFKGNHLRVTPAAKSGGNGTAGNDPALSDADEKRTIFVGNLKYSANEQNLREIFSSCGEIDYIRCLQDGDKGCKGVAYVRFQKPDAVGLALELNETLLDDRPIHVERYLVKKLGAKQARDSTAQGAGSKPKSKNRVNAASAKKRLDKKQDKGGPKSAPTTKSAVNKKKSEYRGVKVDAIKKTRKPKKQNNKMNVMAKKIAPKSSK